MFIEMKSIKDLRDPLYFKKVFLFYEKQLSVDTFNSFQLSVTVVIGGRCQGPGYMEWNTSTGNRGILVFKSMNLDHFQQLIFLS